MAEGSDNTALLADTDHLESHDDVCSQGILPAKSHFKFTTRLLTLLISLLSLATFILLIVTYIRVKSGPFGYVGRTQDTINDLSICLIVNLLVSAPTIFVHLPILINIPINITMMIVIFVFSVIMLEDGWPDSQNTNFCDRETAQCAQARDAIKVAMGVGAGMSLFIGLLYLFVLLIRLTALTRTGFWRHSAKGLWEWGKSIRGWNPTGFTVQFTFSVVPVDRPIQLVQVSSSTEEARLIET